MNQALTLLLPGDLSPGEYRLVLALVDEDTGRLRNLVGADGRWIGDLLPLPGVRVAGPE